MYCSGVSTAGPSRAGALPNIQGVNLPVFLYFGLLAKKILEQKVNLEHFSDVLKSLIKVKVRFCL